MKRNLTAGMPVAFVLALALVATLVPTLAAPRPAYASGSVPAFVKVKKGRSASLAPALTAREKKAYRRALAAVMDYKNQPSTITVNVSDLRLTAAQALHVGYALHSNGEIFWVNTYDDNFFKKDAFTLPCTYSDAAITRMRAKLDRAVERALARLGSGMSAVNKVHTLHDYLIDKVDYGASCKTSYDALVRHKADCFGFTQAMDLLLRRAGFSTDVAYNFAGSHSWNLVKVSGKWYHVDVTWDNGFTGGLFWEKTRCHLYLLQADSYMANDGYTSGERGRWWAHHACSTKKYQETSSFTFEKSCKTYKLYTSGLAADGLRYKVCGSHKVRLVGVSGAAAKRARKLVVPARVSYKGVTYKVVGIGASAFAKAKAKTVEVAATALSASRTKGCLTGSKVKQVKLTGAARAKRATLRKCFAEKNCGRKVKVL